MRLRLETLVSRLPSALGTYTLAMLFLGSWQVLQQPLTADTMILVWIGVPSVLLVILLPDHRYFLPIFPALALIMARGLVGSSLCGPPPIVLALLFCAGNLYLFVDWNRRKYLFSQRGI